MSYIIHITATAERDIIRPEKFRLVDDPVLASWGIRFVIVNNYLAFYTIDTEMQTVIVVRFLYKKSNWNSILRQGFSIF